MACDEHGAPEGRAALEVRVARLEAQMELVARMLGRRPTEEAAVGAQTGPPDGASERGDSAGLVRLTMKQWAAVLGVAADMTNGEIATAMACTESTVKVHLKGAMDRMGVRKRGTIGRIVSRAIERMGGEAFQRFAGVPADLMQRRDDPALSEVWSAIEKKERPNATIG